MQKLLNRLGHLCSMMDTPLLIIFDKIGINSWARYGIDGRHRTAPSCVIYFVPIRKAVHIARKAQFAKLGCISFPSLDIKSFFVLNLLYRPFCVNLLLLIFINIIIQIVVSCFGIFAQSLNLPTPQKISFPVHTQNARSALLSKGLRAFCIHVCNLFYQFRLNSASVRPGFFCSAQRMLHSLLKMSRLCPRKSCTHFVSEARLSAVGSVPSLVIQRM